MQDKSLNGQDGLLQDRVWLFEFVRVYIRN